MKKILLILLCLGFAMTQSIQTKEVVITLSDEEFQSLEIYQDGDQYSILDLSNYITFDFESNYLVTIVDYQPLNYFDGNELSLLRWEEDARS